MIDLLAALLRGERLPALEDVDAEALCASAEENGVAPLLAEQMAAWSGAPVGLLARLAEDARQATATDLVREGELRALVAGFEGAGIKPLLFKGTPLAYSHYPRPDLRPRVDTDVLVASSARTESEAVLGRLGYRPVQQLHADLVMYQRPFARTHLGVVTHLVDLHWRLANPQQFGTIVTYDELLARAEPVSALGRGAAGPCAVHSLLIACVHRVAHHADSSILIWQYDIHLVASRFSVVEWDEFATMAAARGVAAICARSLALTVANFHTRVPQAILDRLTLSSSVDEEPTAAYLAPGRRHIQDVASDFRALSSWRERWQLVRQHLLPSPAYMRDVYAPTSGAPLAILYLRRLWRGAHKWMARPR